MKKELRSTSYNFKDSGKRIRTPYMFRTNICGNMANFSERSLTMFPQDQSRTHLLLCSGMLVLL